MGRSGGADIGRMGGDDMDGRDIGGPDMGGGASWAASSSGGPADIWAPAGIG
jgi:hypothetical protein